MYTKMVQEMNRQLDVSFELTQEITELSTDLLTLSRVLGIFLDNAIEAASFPSGRAFQAKYFFQRSAQRSWTSHRKYADRQCAGADLQHDLRKRSF